MSKRTIHKIFSEIFSIEWVGIFLCACALLFAGCNTTRGVGEDFEAAGEAIQDAAD
ncbi:MAG: entericidin A/B family lipoprotein [Opitutales bacterium]